MLLVSYYTYFLINDHGGKGAMRIPTSNFIFDRFLFLTFEKVDIHVGVLDSKPIQKVFGFLTPSTGAQTIKNNSSSVFPRYVLHHSLLN